MTASMSLTAFLGSCVKLAYDKWAAHRDANAGLSDEEKAAKDAAFQEQGLVVASGLLGGDILALGGAVAQGGQRAHGLRGLLPAAQGNGVQPGMQLRSAGFSKRRG